MFFNFFIFLIIFILSTTIIFNQNNISNSSLTFKYPTNITYTSSDYGYRFIFGKTNFHDGIDFPTIQGTKVYPTYPGVISYTGMYNGYGICIIITHINGYKSLYGHLDENTLVNLGEYVTQNTLIGYVGPKYLSNGVLNGNTTGPHLHFTVFDKSGKTIDPKTLKMSK